MSNKLSNPSHDNARAVSDKRRAIRLGSRPKNETRRSLTRERVHRSCNPLCKRARQTVVPSDLHLSCSIKFHARCENTPLPKRQHRSFDSGTLARNSTIFAATGILPRRFRKPRDCCALSSDANVYFCSSSRTIFFARFHRLDLFAARRTSYERYATVRNSCYERGRRDFMALGGTKIKKDEIASEAFFPRKCTLEYPFVPL